MSDEKVVTSDPVIPLPGTKVAEPVKVNMADPDGALKFNKDTAIFLIYMLYKVNMIDRNRLKNMIRVIEENLPENVVKWLLNEAAKA